MPSIQDEILMKDITIGPLRICRDCGLEAHTQKDLDLFTKQKEQNYGRRNMCYKCYNEYQRKRYKSNPEYKIEHSRKYRKKYPEKIKVALRKYHASHREKSNKRRQKWKEDNPFRHASSNIKYRSRKNGFDFNLTAEYFEQIWDECKGICPMTGVKMKKISGINDPYSMSMDRIVPSKGYIQGNVRLVSLWYNTARSNWGDDLTLEMCQRVAEHEHALLE